MLGIGVGLYIAAGLGVAAMGVKYIRAQVPLDYHADILSAEPIGDATRLVLGTLYKVMGGAFVALGIAVLMLAVFGVWSGSVWTNVAAAGTALVAGGFATLPTMRTERATGVRTPWRIGAVLTAVVSAAFVISLVAQGA